MNKKQKLECIKKFAKLNLKNICERTGVPTQNIYSETASENAVDRVFDAVLLEIDKLEAEMNGKR